MQAADLVRPPGDRRAAPFGQQRRMMSLFLREGTDPVGEAQGLREISGTRRPASGA